MAREKIIENTIAFVKRKLAKEGSGHDWWHIYRVYQMTKRIAKEENVEVFTCELAALLHDLADDKVVGDEEQGKKDIMDWLTGQGVDDDTCKHVMDIIATMSFKGGHSKEMSSLEGKVVRDADRLDAIGAIGIARCFVYAGNKGDVIFDPTLTWREEMTLEEYRKGKSTAINHFYEKLLKLKDLMATKTGAELAQRRHDYMLDFLEEFYEEWEGKR